MSIFGILLVVMAYLIGSISCAIISCRIVGADDPRLSGSKNPGATNVYRIAGRDAAILTLVGDLLKGAIPVWIASLFISDPYFLSFIALAALLGHCFPLFFKFSGGKGVATGFGSLLVLHWMIGLSLLGIWLAVFTLTRTSSLAAIMATLAIPLASFYIFPEAVLPLSVMALVVLLRHYDNILKIFHGEENRFKKK